MAHDKQNAIRDMVDFDVRLTVDDSKDGHYRVEAELRAAEAELYDEETDVTLKVSAKRIILRFDMDGLEVAPGARHHDELRVSSPTKKTTDKTEYRTAASASSSVGGKLGAEGASANAEANLRGEASVSASRTVEATAETTERFVIARPGDRWEIVEGEGRSLNATYLTSDTPLCTVRSKKGANQLGISATAEVFERDLQIDVVTTKSLLGRATTTKKKLVAIVIAKSIAMSMATKYSGKIVVSRVETDVEG